jgi:hypothetical protein
MARMTTVEVKRWHNTPQGERSFDWQSMSVEEGLRLRDETFRCPQCHGRVRLMSASQNPPMAAHGEHQRRHKGCPLGDCFDGGEVRKQPLPLT